MDAIAGDGASPFDLLPNELVEIPIKMVLADLSPSEKTEFLIGVIAKVSARFRTFTALNGEVWIKGDEKSTRKVIQEFANDRIHRLKIEYQGDVTISPLDMFTIAAKCPKLEYLSIFPCPRAAIQYSPRLVNIKIYSPENPPENPFKNLYKKFTNMKLRHVSKVREDFRKDFRECIELRPSGSIKMPFWPNFIEPWTSLKELRLSMVEIGSVRGFELHHSLPNLEYLQIGDTKVIQYT